MEAIEAGRCGYKGWLKDVLFVPEVQETGMGGRGVAVRLEPAKPVVRVVASGGADDETLDGAGGRDVAPSSVGGVVCSGVLLGGRERALVE